MAEKHISDILGDHTYRIPEAFREDVLGGEVPESLMHIERAVGTFRDAVDQLLTDRDELLNRIELLAKQDPEVLRALVQDYSLGRTLSTLLEQIQEAKDDLEEYLKEL